MLAQTWSALHHRTQECTHLQSGSTAANTQISASKYAHLRKPEKTFVSAWQGADGTYCGPFSSPTFPECALHCAGVVSSVESCRSGQSHIEQSTAIGCAHAPATSSWPLCLLLDLLLAEAPQCRQAQSVLLSCYKDEPRKRLSACCCLQMVGLVLFRSNAGVLCVLKLGSVPSQSAGTYEERSREFRQNPIDFSECLV